MGPRVQEGQGSTKSRVGLKKSPKLKGSQARWVQSSRVHRPEWGTKFKGPQARGVQSSIKGPPRARSDRSKAQGPEGPMARLIQSSIKGIWVHGPAGSKMQGPKSPLARWTQLGHIITPTFFHVILILNLTDFFASLCEQHHTRWPRWSLSCAVCMLSNPERPIPEDPSLPNSRARGRRGKGLLFLLASNRLGLSFFWLCAALCLCDGE